MLTDSVAVITPGDGEKVGMAAVGVPGGSPGLMEYVARDELLAVPPENAALAKTITPHGGVPAVHDTANGAEYVVDGVHGKLPAATVQ